MRYSHRRTFLKSVGAATALSFTGVATATGQIDTLVSIHRSKLPENLGFSANGDLYFGITAGQLRRLPASRTDETGLPLSATDLVATFDGSVLGVAVADGTPYLALVTGDERTGVYAVTDDGPEQLATIRGFPNGVLYDGENGRLLVTESFGGLVYTVSLAERTADVWVDSPLLDTPGFGANGLTFGPGGDVFVTVTQTGEGTGRILRVPVLADGSAGEPETYCEGPELLGADGLTARGPQLYVAVNQQDTVVRVNPARKVIPVVSDGPLAFPSDVLFGPAPGQRGDLFVCNFANPRPEQAAILRTHP